MFVNRHTVEVTTEADGSATAYSEQVSGLLSQIRYVKPGSGGFSDGVDFTITLEDTGETLWTEANVNASKTVAPRQPTHSTAGVAALYAAAGEAVNDMIAVSGRIKIVIAAGGNVTSGDFHFVTI